MQRRALSVLFSVLALALAAVAVAALVHAGSAGRWIVGIAAAAVALWFATLARAALRK